MNEFLKRFKTTRFNTCSDRLSARTATLADYLDVVRSNTLLPKSKEAAPAWALCNDTGTSEGAPNGLIQLDFDKVVDVSGLRRALIEYGGFLAVVRTFSGHGLVALGDVGKRCAADPEQVKRLIYAPLRVYLRECGMTEGIDYKLDESCAKPCQLRFESRDKDAWVAPRHTRLYANPDDDSGLLTHPVSLLAEAFRPGEVASPAGLCAALTAISMAANLRSRMTANAAAYAARAFCVLIGPPGSRKTTLLDAVQDTARALGVTVSDPKNAPTLRDHIMQCGCDELVEPSTQGKKPVTRLIERTTRPADSLMVCVDEAGQRLRTRVQDESCGSLAAMLRQCNGERITLEGTVKQDRKGSCRVPAHVSVLLASTPAQWAEYVGAIRQDNGESRRMIELWQDAEASDPFTSAPAAYDAEMALESLRRLHEVGSLWQDAGVVFEPAKDARGAIRAAITWLCSTGMDAPSAQSLLMCYATLCAGLRASSEGGTTIEPRDIHACVCILRRVLDARARLTSERERAEAASYKPDGTVWAEILAWIEKNPRRDKTLEKIARRPPQYRRVYDEMLAQHALTCAKDEATGKYLLRVATAEELEQGEEAHDTRKAVVAAETRQLAASRKAYAECTEDEREARVLAYLEKWRMDNALVEGNRNIALNKLAWGLQQSGMWDATARGVYDVVAAHSGLGAGEIRTLMRERKKAKK